MLVNRLHSKRNFKPITILHTADIHLPERRKELVRGMNWRFGCPFQTFEATVNTANHLGVDLVLVSGDLFDVYSPSKETVSFVLEQFTRLKSPAILIPGNHDCLEESETFCLPEWTRGDMRPYVITDFFGELLEIPALPVTVWGRAMMQHSPLFEPLKGLPSRNGNSWHIAMGHGFYYEHGKTGYRASPIHAHQIQSADWDYFAFGHTHVHVDVSQGKVKAAYSGSPVPSWNPRAEVLLVRLDGRRNEPVSITKFPLLNGKG